MNRYKEKRIKKTLIFIIILMFLIIIAFWMYNMYSKINISNYSETNVQGVQKVSKTVEEENIKSTQIVDVIENVTKGVVGISKIKNNGNSIFLKDGAKQLGLGTGFIVSENGYIVTNEHVSGGKFSNCYVTLENGKIYNGSVVWSDTDLDISIVKVNMKDLSFLEIGDSNNLRIAEPVYAIGNPIGYEFQRTVTSGIISAINRTIKFDEDEREIYMSNLIQTDATINPGNSGGPLIDVEGKVVGINSVKITTAEGIGFAMPINIVKPIIQKYIKTGSFEEATIGVFAYDKNVIPYLNSDLKFDTGIYIAQVNRGSCAEKADLKEGDIISKIDGIEINKMNDLKEYIYNKNPGEEVTLSISRNNNISEIKIILDKK